MFRKLYLLALITVLFSAVSVFAQSEYESVNSSNLTSASLPTGALRVFPNHVPTEIDQTLDKLVSGGNGKLRRGESEVLLWTGKDLKKTGAGAIVNRLTDTLKTGGWKYELGGTENGVSFFSLLKDGANRRAIIGFFGEADGTLVFAWTELHANDGEPNNSKSEIEEPKANTASQANSNKITYAQSGNVSDYSFTTPAGWSRSDSASEIVLSKDGNNKIKFLPLMNSSGNLERDAEKIIWQVFKGYNAWSGNGFEADYGTFEKGKTIQGLEYFRAYRYAKKASDDSAFPESRFDAIILLVKVGDKVAVIAGNQPFQTDYARDSTLNAIDLILYDLTFKSAPNSYNLKNELLGSWSAASGSVGLAYTFNPNGTFHKGGAVQFRTKHDEQREKVQTTSYGMTDNYSVSGNILTQSYKRTGEVVKYKTRIYYTKYNKDEWQHKVGFLPTTNNNGDTIVLRRSN